MQGSSLVVFVCLVARATASGSRWGTVCNPGSFGDDGVARGAGFLSHDGLTALPSEFETPEMKVPILPGPLFAFKAETVIRTGSNEGVIVSGIKLFPISSEGGRAYYASGKNFQIYY